LRHIALSHNIWKNHLLPDSHVIDATCGNGHDTLFLAKCVPDGFVYAIDIQEDAIAQTKKRVIDYKNSSFFKQSHENFPKIESPIDLIVYNLGYLPGSDKSLTTLYESTKKSLQKALNLLSKRGVISIMLYPGHLEGFREKNFLLDFAGSLINYTTTHYQWPQKEKKPSLLVINSQ